MKGDSRQEMNEQMLLEAVDKHIQGAVNEVRRAAAPCPHCYPFFGRGPGATWTNNAAVIANAAGYGDLALFESGWLAMITSHYFDRFLPHGVRVVHLLLLSYTRCVQVYYRPQKTAPPSPAAATQAQGCQTCSLSASQRSLHHMRMLEAGH